MKYVTFKVDQFAGGGFAPGNPGGLSEGINLDHIVLISDNGRAPSNPGGEQGITLYTESYDYANDVNYFSVSLNAYTAFPQRETVSFSSAIDAVTKAIENPSNFVDSIGTDVPSGLPVLWSGFAYIK
jgi:hypothetical protein